jgi:hypothetical protein
MRLDVVSIRSIFAVCSSAAFTVKEYSVTALAKSDSGDNGFKVIFYPQILKTGVV